jgi:hypothetical protein
MNILFRASMIGKLMTEPRSKAEGPLSQGAKSAIRDMAAQQILGIEFEIAGKPVDKGIECEPDSTGLLNRVLGRALVKNTERRNDGYLTGECDLFDPAHREGFDLKTAWSAATFPILPEDIGGSQRTLYEWQCRAYMALWDAPRWTIAYALVNTPEHLIGYEPQSMHFFDHIPEHMRLTLWTVERDAALEAAMREKVKHARAYYAQVLADFDRTHRLPGAEPVAQAAPVAAPAPAPAAELATPDF